METSHVNDAGQMTLYPEWVISGSSEGQSQTSGLEHIADIDGTKADIGLSMSGSINLEHCCHINPTRPQGEMMTDQQIATTGQGRDTAGRWLPGTSGNPKGMPPRKKIVDGLWLELNRRDENGVKHLQRCQRRLVDIAMNGEPRDSLAANKLLVEIFGARLDAGEGNGAKGGAVINVILRDVSAAPVVDITAEETE